MFEKPDLVVCKSVISYKKNSTVDDFCEKMNASYGTLQGFDCQICKNRGFIFVNKNGEAVSVQCKCVNVRNTLQRLKNAGLFSAIERLTFDKFETLEDWQIRSKRTAEKFAHDPGDKWLFAGGAVGAGKSHLCTAAFSKLIQDGKNGRYMLWRGESDLLKMKKKDADSYEEAIEPLKHTDVLYIDDFFKTEANAKPTPADISLAHEILNFRYVSEKTTIISSEYFLSDLIRIDEAVGSRIAERSIGSCIQILKKPGRNWRIRSLNF